MTENNYAEKIAHLLRKAEDKAATDAERELYSRKAEDLMVKWGVAEAVARQQMGYDNAKQDPIIELKQRIVGTYHAGELRIGADIAYGLGNLRVLQSKLRGQQATVIYIIGFESDVKRWEQLFVSLRLQAANAVTQWVKAERKAGRWSDAHWARELTWMSYDADFKATTKTHPSVGQIHHEKFKARRQFLISFGNTVRTRLHAMTKETVKATTGAEIAVRDRSALVNDWVEDKYGTLTSKGRGISYNQRGAAAGREAGSRANLGGREMPQPRKGLGK